MTEDKNDGLKILLYSFMIFGLFAAFACYFNDYLEDHGVIEKTSWSTYIYLGEFEDAYAKNDPCTWNNS